MNNEETKVLFDEKVSGSTIGLVIFAAIGLGVSFKYGVTKAVDGVKYLKAKSDERKELKAEVVDDIDSIDE